MVLLDCVTSIHALLAVRAPEPQRHQQAVRKAGKKLHHAAWLHQGRANGKPQDGSSKQGRGSMAKGVKAGWHSAGDRSVQNCRPEAAQGPT